MFLFVCYLLRDVAFWNGILFEEVNSLKNYESRTGCMRYLPDEPNLVLSRRGCTIIIHERRWICECVERLRCGRCGQGCDSFGWNRLCQYLACTGSGVGYGRYRSSK